MIHDEPWAERLVRSVAAAMTAGELVAFVAFAFGFLLVAATDSDPTWVVARAAANLWGLLLLGLMFAGAFLGLAMALPVLLAGQWIRPGNRNLVFAVGAAAAIVSAMGALTLGSDLSMPLAAAALLAATGLGGIYFYALYWRWAWVEQCAS
jgi:hypothetical protein